MQTKLKISCMFIVLITCRMLVGCGKTSPWHKEEDSVHNSPIPSAPTAAPVPAGGAPDEMGSVNKASITNLDELIQLIGSSSWYSSGANCSGKTIAIFDNGFSGLEDSKGVRLPPTLTVEKAPANAALDTAHGTKLAEIIWALCTGNRVYSPARPGPILKLYNTNGYTNLAGAVDAVTTSPVDIVLYSQVWEFGGNFDGRGFINGLVNKVTSRGILWINAAGNYGQTSWQNLIKFNARGEVTLPHEGRYLRFTVNSPQTLTKITLAWNDFGEDKTYKTNQDLDLFLEDSSHKQITSGQLIQDGQDHGTNAGYSAYAREQFSAMLEPGVYYLRITSPRPTAFNAQSRLRIGADGRDLIFIDQTPEASVMIPADNPTVLTVGASDVDFSSSGTVNGSSNHKPEVLAPSVLTFDNGLTFAGSSTAAAVAAAGIALYEGRCGDVSYAGWTRIFSNEWMGVKTKTTSAAAPTFKLPANARCLDKN